jgi:hypothetical protein
MPASRSVVSMLLRELGDFLYTLKAGPAGGLRPPSGPATTRRPPGSRLTLTPGDQKGQWRRVIDAIAAEVLVEDEDSRAALGAQYHVLVQLEPGDLDRLAADPTFG